VDRRAPIGYDLPADLPAATMYGATPFSRYSTLTWNQSDVIGLKVLRRIKAIRLSRFGVFSLVLAVLGPPALISFASISSGAASQVADETKFEAWWADLENREPDATRALLNLAARPKDAVPFLKTRMKPLTISSGQVKALLLKLGSSNEALSKPAFEELEYFDPRLAIELETLMDRYTEYPLRQRLVAVLSGRDLDSLNDYEDLKIRPVGTGFNFSGNKRAVGVINWWAEHRVDRLSPGGLGGGEKKKWTRAIRAIVLLEHIRTPDAVAILNDMASGHPDAYPTKVAKQALAAIRDSSAGASPDKHTPAAPVGPDARRPAQARP
jgi:hypothetical protein